MRSHSAPRKMSHDERFRHIDYLDLPLAQKTATKQTTHKTATPRPKQPHGTKSAIRTSSRLP